MKSKLGWHTHQWSNEVWNPIKCEACKRHDKVMVKDVFKMSKIKLKMKFASMSYCFKMIGNCECGSICYGIFEILKHNKKCDKEFYDIREREDK